MTHSQIDIELNLLKAMLYGNILKTSPGAEPQIDAAMEEIRKSLNRVFAAGQKDGYIEAYDDEAFERGEDAGFKVGYDCGYYDGSQSVE